MEEKNLQQNPQETIAPVEENKQINPSSSVSEKPKKNFSLTMILSFATIIASLIAVFFYFQNTKLRGELGKEIPSPTPIETPDPAESWETYTDTEFKFSFQYPKEVKLEKDECVFLNIVGPTQTNDTEPFDGLYLNICPKNLENLTIDEWIENDLTTFVEILKPKTKILINTYPAYSYQASTELLSEKRTVIESPILKSQIILISDISKDPTNQGYEELVNQILDTFKFNQNQSSKINCEDPRPEVCTMECIVNPPYICGSDNKSSCSTCQACSNKDVLWYEIKETVCE